MSTTTSPIEHQSSESKLGNSETASIQMASSIPENEFQYKTISKSAVACCIFAFLAITAYLAQIFVLLPILGIGFGFLALSSIKRYPDELIGKVPAQIGLVVSLFVLVTSIALHSYIYSTEVPEGYQRITFWDLRNNDRVTSIPFSEKAYDLDGKKVFLKGYVRPGMKKTGLKEFVLVGDFGDCCFGGNPDPTEVVAIEIQTDDTVDHSYSLRKIGGTFRLNPASRPINEDGLPVVYYTIEADHLR